ncbi:MAG: phosphoribosylformylglycinamidine cyclo-ligase [Lentisphaeria bacterium]
MKSPTKATGKSYADSGVDIDYAHELLDRVKAKISSTKRPEVLAPIGGFGGLFQLDLSGYTEPVLVSSVDGVGTKLMVAAMMEKYDSVGHDIVNHCIDDIIVQGAEPLYFMDYLGIGRLRSPLYEQVLEGIADACAAQNVAVLGGETAEMPGMYGDDFDLVGCITGVVEKSEIISGDKIRPGHILIGLPSNGLHTNGYSLARKVLFDNAGYEVNSKADGLDQTIGEALLQPHSCYWPAVKRLKAHGIHLDGIAHITGGGWFDNIKRVLPQDCAAICDAGTLPVPPIFDLIQSEGEIETEEMHRVFNMGMGMVLIIPAENVDGTLQACSEEGFEAAVMGEIVFGEQEVSLRG